MTKSEQIKKFLETLHPESVFEIRALGLHGRGLAWQGYAKGSVSGYFNDAQTVLNVITELEKQKPKGIYVTLNPVGESLLGRADSKFMGGLENATKSKEVDCLKHLLIDLDPIRPSGISSTDSERRYAQLKSEEVVEYLSSEGWPEPLLIGMSGNGYHVIYRLDDFPNDEDHIRLIKDTLKTLSEKFSDDKVKLDESVSGPSGLTKVMGTMTRKGDHTERNVSTGRHS